LPSSGGTFGSITRRLSVMEESTVREVFDLFDEDGDGCISREELAIVIQSMLGTSNIVT
jgi:Ca2+-binding EF-hand superfamily protein